MVHCQTYPSPLIQSYVLFESIGPVCGLEIVGWKTSKEMIYFEDLKKRFSHALENKFPLGEKIHNCGHLRENSPHRNIY